MEYVVLVSISIALVAWVVYYVKKKANEDKLNELRSTWGRKKNEPLFFGRISALAEATFTSPYHRLTTQTLIDIDFEELFTFIDRTYSKPGQQFLFKKLIEPDRKHIDIFEQLSETFARDQKLREETQRLLLELSDNDAYQIPTLLHEKIIEPPDWIKMAPFLSIITVVFGVASFFQPILILVVLSLSTLNMLLHYWCKRTTFQLQRALPQLNILINVSKLLSAKRELSFHPSVGDNIRALIPVQRKLGLISFDNAGANSMKSELAQALSYITDLLKTLLLIDVLMIFSAARELETKKSSVLDLLNYIGIIDTGMSIGSLRASGLQICKPTFVSRTKALSAKEIYHPLIKACVRNDFSVIEKGFLITGSNMSGKSTFLRTLTINSILAQSINVCFAEEFRSPTLRQFSSIRIDDNLFDSTSYFFQEVKTIGHLVEEAQGNQQNLFLLDEVFKGTNSIERISAAKSILSFLNKSENIVVVCTHDLELTQLLSTEFDLFHFTESVDNNELRFDHKLKAGPLRQTNAIKLLELAQYPREITDNARNISALLLERANSS